MFFRRSLERLTRSAVFWRRLPPEFDNAPLLAGAAGGLKFLLPGRRYDSELLRNVREIVSSDDVVWDVGANIGLFAVAAAVRAGAAGAVYAFEPDTWLVSLLRRTAVMQSKRHAAINVVPTAVASAVALRHFDIADRARASNALSEYGHGMSGGVRETQLVPAFNLDTLLELLPPPTVLKIDVEGAEVEVLRGQTRMLERVRPTILCEVGKSVEDVTSILSSAGYVLYDGAVPLLHRIQSPKATWNTVAIHASSRLLKNL
jgi:FkbM family methyltransferase